MHAFLAMPFVPGTFLHRQHQRHGHLRRLHRGELWRGSYSDRVSIREFVRFASASFVLCVSFGICQVRCVRHGPGRRGGARLDSAAFSAIAEQRRDEKTFVGWLCCHHPARVREHDPQAAGRGARPHHDLVGHSAGQSCRLCGHQPRAA